MDTQATPTSDDIVTLAAGDLDVAIALLDLFVDPTPATPASDS
jgi:hypothetical protein